MGRIHGNQLDLSLLHSPAFSSNSWHDFNMIEDEKDQQMTIFYNGRVCVLDATELQARAILWSATHDVELMMKTMSGLGANMATFYLKLQLHGIQGCSIKRSLKLFLQQKRDSEPSKYSISLPSSITQPSAFSPSIGALQPCKI